MITCGGCNRVFSGRVLPEHLCDGSAFGELGQDPDKFEKERISGLPKTPQAVEAFERQQDIAAMARTRQPALVRASHGITPESLNPGGGQKGETFKWDVYHDVSSDAPVGAVPVAQSLEHVRGDRMEPGQPRTALTRAVDNRQEIAEVMRPMIREAFGELTTFLSGLKGDIQEQSALLKHIDAPMEAVVDSHERAASSFETLRRDILDGGMSKLEKVLDTAGLSEQASKAERRLEELVQRIDAKIGAAFKSHAADMLSILHLLERLQARELRETKNRIQRAATTAVRRGPKV